MKPKNLYFFSRPHLWVMICYHGSGTKGLKKLTYSEDYSRFGGADGLLHGAAIYLTISETEAQAYATGGSYYKIKVSGEVFDATSREELQNFVKQFEEKIGVEIDLVNHPLIQTLIKNTISGKSSGVIFAQNLFLIITNEIGLYRQIIEETLHADVDACLSLIETLFHYQIIKLNNKTETWVLCLNLDGQGLEILEEIELE